MSLKRKIDEARKVYQDRLGRHMLENTTNQEITIDNMVFYIYNNKVHVIFVDDEYFGQGGTI